MADTYIEDTDANYLITDRVAYNSVSATTDKILLNATRINYDVGVFTQVAEKPARGQTTITGAIAYGDYLGFTNPVIRVEGIIDLQDYADGTVPPSAASGYKNVCLKLLQQIYKSGHVFTLTDKYNASTPSVYRTTGSL